MRHLVANRSMRVLGLQTLALPSICCSRSACSLSRSRLAMESCCCNDLSWAFMCSSRPAFSELSASRCSCRNATIATEFGPAGSVCADVPFLRNLSEV